MSLMLLGLFLGAAYLACRSFGERGSGNRGGNRRAPPGVLAVVYGAPALFLAFVLWTSRDDATRFRFALLGLGFRGGEHIEVAVGGDRDEHEVWISAFAEGRSRRSTLIGRLLFDPRAEDAAALTWEPAVGEPPIGEPAPGLMGVRLAGEPLRPLRALELEDGDRLRIAERTWEVRFPGGILGPAARFTDPEGNQIELPRRYGELPLTRFEIPIWKTQPALLETYPAAWLDKAIDGEVASPAPASFFFWRSRGLLRASRLWLAVRDGDVELERGGEPVSLPERIALPPEASLHLLSPPRWDEAGFRAGGVRDRRSFRWRGGKRSLVLVYDTPEIYVLSPQGLEELAFEASEVHRPLGGTEGGQQGPLRVHVSMGGWQITDKSLHFRHASRKIALEALATLEIPRELIRHPRRDLTFRAATPRGQRRARFGEPVWLGGEHLAAVQIDLLSPPVLLGLLALALALLKAAAARSARLGTPQLFFAAAVEAVVTLRLLIGYRAWVLPPFKQEAYELALVAWSLLPWTWLLIGASRREDRRESLLAALPALGGLFFSFAWCAALGGGGFRYRVWLLCHALALAAWAARATGALDALTQRCGRWLAAVRGERAVWALWIAAAFLPGLARIGLVFFGSRESLQIGGQRLALTLAHVPLAILLEGAYLVWLWRRISDKGRMSAADLAPALALVAGTWLLPALFVSDLGLFLLHVPVFLIALSSVVLTAGRRLAEDGLAANRRWLQWAPAAAFAAYLSLAAFPIGARALIGALPRQATLELGSERNYLRLLAFAYPKRLERLARRGSEELMIMSTVMRSYTSGPFTGRGYFRSEISPHLQTTALREHAPAVFVAGEWGLAGIFGLLSMYLLAAACGFSFAPWRSADRWLRPEAGAEDLGSDFGGAIACLAGLTFAVPSIYMVLANYRLTLFTGKNAYLLGLDSTADVLEAFALILLCGLGAAMLFDGEEGR